MELDRLLEMLVAKNSLQAHLVSDEPPRIWNDGVWQSASTPLVAGRLNRMLVLAAPPEVRAVVHDLNANYEFDVSGTGGLYRVHVDVVAGRRSVFVTRLDANGVPLRPIDDGTSDFGFPSTAETVSPTPPEPLPSQAQSSEADQWYYSHAGQSMGPHSFEQMASLVKSGGILPETMVFNSRMGDWQPIRLTELGRFRAPDNAGEWVAPTANWQAPSQAEIRSEKILIRSLVIGGIGMAVLLIGWIALAQVRGANRQQDYSPQATAMVEELSKNTTSGLLHNVRVKRNKTGSDVTTDSDSYSGEAQYTNNYLADVSIETTKRDFLARPEEWELKVQAHDFSSELESRVRAHMNKQYATANNPFRMDSISLSNDGNNLYSGTCHWDDDTNGSVSAQITTFDADGELSKWQVSVHPN